MEGFQTTLLNGNKKPWVEANIDYWLSSVGFFDQFTKVGAQTLINRFNKAEKAFEKMLSYHSQDTTGEKKI